MRPSRPRGRSVDRTRPRSSDKTPDDGGYRARSPDHAPSEVRGDATKSAQASQDAWALERKARHEPTFPIVVSIIGPADLTAEFGKGSGVTPRV